MRITVAVEDLEPAAGGDRAAKQTGRDRRRRRIVESARQCARPSAASRLQLERARTVASSLDLRGAKVQEALEVLDRYLDDASLAGLEQVTIIHGMGTGALRDVGQRARRRASARQVVAAGRSRRGRRRSHDRLALIAGPARTARAGCDNRSRWRRQERLVATWRSAPSLATSSGGSGRRRAIGHDRGRDRDLRRRRGTHWRCEAPSARPSKSTPGASSSGASGWTPLRYVIELAGRRVAVGLDPGAAVWAPCGRSAAANPLRAARSGSPRDRIRPPPRPRWQGCGSSPGSAMRLP